MRKEATREHVERDKMAKRTLLCLHFVIVHVDLDGAIDFLVADLK